MAFIQKLALIFDVLNRLERNDDINTCIRYAKFSHVALSESTITVEV